MTRRSNNSTIITNALVLRHSLTESEARLWQVLRMNQLKNVHFRRQYIIGPYIVDFCAPRKKVIVELDGSQHLDQQEYDGERTCFLEAQGYRVLRFWNNEVKNNLDAVVKAILDALE